MYPAIFTGAVMLNFKVEQYPAQRDRDGWKQYVKRYVCGELNSSQYECVHVTSPFLLAHYSKLAFHL